MSLPDPGETTARPIRRAGRLRLYAPFVALAVIAAAWSIGWFVIRDRIVGGVDTWMASEAAANRVWTCPDRSVAGFPFRLELRCSGLTLTRPDVTATLGPVTIVSQIYDWNHVIAEATGPLRVVAGSTEVISSWRLFEASAASVGGRLQRLAIVAEEPITRVIYPDASTLDVTSRHVEVHGRQSPDNAASVDLAVSTQGSVIPGLDALIGATEPADIDLVLTVTQARDLPARPLWSELERWRAAGGVVDVTRANLTSGDRRTAASGKIGLDDLHRPQGELQASARNLGGFIGQFTGKSGVGRLLGALAGGVRRQAPQGAPDPAAPPLDPLPPLRLEGGRLQVGPIAIPGFRIQPLY